MFRTALFILGLCFQAHAGCYDYLLELGRLDPNPNAKIATREHLSYGQIASGDDLKNLPEGRYVYLLERDGTLVWSNAVPSHDVNLDSNDPVVVSHRSLAKFQSDRTQRPLDVVAGGEFIIVEIDGKSYVQETNNRSFTFMGNAVPLAAADRALALKGLPIDAKTMSVDYSVNGPDVERHADSALKAVEEIRHSRDSEMVALKRLVARFQKKFPRPNTHGHIDLPKFNEALSDALTRIRESHEPGAPVYEMTWHACFYFPYLERQGLPHVLDDLAYKKLKVADVEAALEKAGLF